jgi:hypothetical protein
MTRSNKVQHLDAKSQSIQENGHGNVYLGSPYHRLSLQLSLNRNNSQMGEIPIENKRKIFAFGMNEHMGHASTAEIPDSGNSRRRDLSTCSVVARTENTNVRNDDNMESTKYDRQEDGSMIDMSGRRRNHSIVSSGRLSRLSNGSSFSGKPDSSVSRNQIARRKHEFLRQKSQEQLASKQRFFQNHIMQIEEHEKRDSLSDSQSQDEIDSLKRPLSVSPLPHDLDSMRVMRKKDFTMDNFSSDQDSCGSGTASQYFTFQPQNERIRVKY